MRSLHGDTEGVTMVEVDTVGPVSVLRIDHGKVNALDLDLLRELARIFARLDTAVVLTGRGSVFSAGVDLRAIATGGRAYTAAFLAALSEVFVAVFDHPRPTVAAINGHAIAGGCILALACDVRLITDVPTTRFGLTELAVGVPFPTTAIEIVRYATGSAATGLALGAQTVGPAEAYRWGLVDQKVAAYELDATALARANTLASYDADAYALAKRQLHRPVQSAIAAGGPVDEPDVVAGWTSAATVARIEAYMAALASRR